MPSSKKQAVPPSKAVPGKKLPFMTGSEKAGKGMNKKARKGC